VSMRKAAGFARGLPACLRVTSAIYGQIAGGLDVTPLLLTQVSAVPAVPEPEESSSQSDLLFPDAVFPRIWLPLVIRPEKDAVLREIEPHAVVPQHVVAR
jgi:hypothetical protein